MDEFRKELEDYFCRFTFGQFVTLILLEIVTLFFVFYLGARYGQDLLGERRSASRQESVLPKDGPRNVDDIVGTPPMDYTYPEVLTGKEGSRAIRVKPSGLTASEYERQSQRETEAPPIEEVRAPAPVERREEASAQPEGGVAARIEVKEEKKQAGRFAIQVGSYQSESEAAGVLQRWKGRGYSAFLSVGEIPDKGTWYRVRIGGFPSREAAQGYLEKFKVKEKTTALVVSVP